MACRHLELGDGVADDFQRMDEAEAVRVELLVQCGLVHQSTDYVMGNEQGIQFLDHADRFQAAEGAARQALVGVNFVDYEFDFPALMVSTGQVVGWIAFRIQEGGNQTMLFPITRQGWILNGVLEDAHQEAQATFAASAGGWG